MSWVAIAGTGRTADILADALRKEVEVTDEPVKLFAINSSQSRARRNGFCGKPSKRTLGVSPPLPTGFQQSL
jgi:hypothetical protein